MTEVRSIHSEITAEIKILKKKLTPDLLFKHYVKGLRLSVRQVFEFTVVIIEYPEVFSKFRDMIEGAQKSTSNIEVIIKEGEEAIANGIDISEVNAVIEAVYIVSRSASTLIFSILCDFTDYDVRKALTSTNQGTNLLFINSN